jgi:hypothetical protein
LLLTSGLTLAVLVSGCGGGGARTTTRPLAGKVVTGPGFTFRAPSAWAATVSAREAVARGNRVTLVSVTVLPLAKRYRPKLFPKVAGELDRVAASYAALLKGKVVARRTAVVAGGRVRQYDIAHGELLDRLTFVLHGKTNDQLICRWRKTAAEPAACSMLLRSFKHR